MTDRHAHGALPEATVEELRELQAHVGLGNAANGWHDRTRELREMDRNARHVNSTAQMDAPSWVRAGLIDHAVATLALIDTEVSEAIEELRNGRRPDETYYPSAPHTDEGGSVVNAFSEAPFKPEGVPSELADIVIRCFDFAARFDIDLAAMIDEKLTYNATRGKMHGGKKL